MQVSDAPDKLQRTFLSPAMQEAMDLLQEWMTDAGMRTWVDMMGNVHGRVDAPNSTAPVLLLGSHFVSGPYELSQSSSATVWGFLECFVRF